MIGKIFTFISGVIGLGIGIALIAFGVGTLKVLYSDVSNRPERLEKLADTKPSGLSPHGELSKIFAVGSDYTDLQRENKEKEITGKVV